MTRSGPVTIGRSASSEGHFSAPQAERSNQRMGVPAALPSMRVVPLRKRETDHDAALRRAFAIVDHGIGEMWDAIIEWRLLANWYAAMEGRR